MIPDYPRLNFPAVKLRISQRGEQMTVWDPLRGIYLVLTPEEWVRRHLIGFLISHCGAQPMRIVQEYAVAMNGSPQRADVVVVDDRARPLVLVECKAAGIRIDPYGPFSPLVSHELYAGLIHRFFQILLHIRIYFG